MKLSHAHDNEKLEFLYNIVQEFENKEKCELVLIKINSYKLAIFYL